MDSYYTPIEQIEVILSTMWLFFCHNNKVRSHWSNAFPDMIYLNGFVMYLLIRKSVGMCCLHNATHWHSSSFLVTHWRTNVGQGVSGWAGTSHMLCRTSYKSQQMDQPNSLLNLTNLVQFCLLNDVDHYEIIESAFLKYCEY